MEVSHLWEAWSWKKKLNGRDSRGGIGITFYQLFQFQQPAPLYNAPHTGNKKAPHTLCAKPTPSHWKWRKTCLQGQQIPPGCLFETLISQKWLKVLGSKPIYPTRSPKLLLNVVHDRTPKSKGSKVVIIFLHLMWFCPCWGGTLFWPKVNIQYLPEQVASYTSYFFPNWEPHAKFQAILTGRFWDLWKKYHFLGMGAPHYTRRQTGPSPAGNDKRFDKIRKKPWSWPPSGNWGRPVALFGIRRRRACLGMPTDGGRWCEYVALTLVMFEWK